MRFVLCALVLAACGSGSEEPDLGDLGVVVDLADDLSAADDLSVPPDLLLPCGLYPAACCPGDSCQLDQTCLTDPTAGKVCYPCGHQDQPCCYTGPACVEPGTSCIMPDASTPICSA